MYWYLDTLVIAHDQVRVKEYTTKSNSMPYIRRCPGEARNHATDSPDKDYRQNSNISRTNPKLKCFSSRLEMDNISLEMDNISQATFSNVFSSMKCLNFD